ncbi:PEP-CTERM sorting domain-containing protein, partial [Nitrosospira sp. Nsp2]
ASAVAPTSVPEPATYALILMGLGMVGWTRRRS